MARIDKEVIGEAAREATRRLREDCPKLLDLLGRVLDANKGAATDREWYAEGLVNKFFDHAFFALYLSQSPNTLDFSSRAVKLSGVASIDVLTRATFEAFLTFHYVFYTPKTEEDKNYRYWAYILAGLKDRQDFPAVTTEQKRVLVNDKKAIKELSDKLQLNAEFRSLSAGQKKEVLKGKWRLKSWREIAEDANLSRILASDMYSHLCGFAHSSSLSVRQIKIAYKKHDEKSLIEPSIIVVSIVAANMILEYCELFKWSKGVLNQDQERMKLVDLWIKLGRG